MKEHALSFAERKRLLNLRDARMFVLQICREERVKRPAPDALEYLASALVRLTLEASQATTLAHS